jgi:hypothetical protein
LQFRSRKWFIIREKLESTTGEESSSTTRGTSGSSSSEVRDGYGNESGCQSCSQETQTDELLELQGSINLSRCEDADNEKDDHEDTRHFVEVLQGDFEQLVLFASRMHSAKVNKYFK